MAAPRQLLTLDVSRRNSARQDLYLGEGDVRGTTLIASITEYGKPFDCDGYVPYLMVPVSKDVMYRAAGTVSGSIVTIEVDESALGDAVGRLPGAYVSLESEDGSITSTQRFDVIVMESMRDVQTHEQLLADMDAMRARIEELEQQIADTQDDGSEG